MQKLGYIMTIVCMNDVAILEIIRHHVLNHTVKAYIVHHVRDYQHPHKCLLLHTLGLDLLFS